MLTWIKGLFVAPKHSPPAARITFPDPPTVEQDDQESQVISLRIKLPSRVPAATNPPSKLPAGPPKIQRSATRLSSFNFASSRQLQQLNRTGIETAADLKAARCKHLVTQGQLSASAGRWLQRRRQIIVLFLSIRSLRPVDAVILHTIHRRRPSTVASEQPIRLHRDIQRFLLTSAGQRLLGYKQPPTMIAVEKWVEHARRRTSRDAKP